MLVGEEREEKGREKRNESEPSREYERRSNDDYSRLTKVGAKPVARETSQSS